MTAGEAAAALLDALSRTGAEVRDARAAYDDRCSRRAQLYRELVDLEVPLTEIARAAGVSRGAVRSTLESTTLPVG